MPCPPWACGVPSWSSKVKCVDTSKLIIRFFPLNERLVVVLLHCLPTPKIIGIGNTKMLPYTNMSAIPGMVCDDTG